MYDYPVALIQNVYDGRNYANLDDVFFAELQVLFLLFKYYFVHLELFLSRLTCSKNVVLVVKCVEL